MFFLLVFLKPLSFLKQLFWVSFFGRPSLSIHHLVCVFSGQLIQFLALFLSCPQPPAMTFPYLWGTKLYSYSFSLSCAFWESELGTFFLAEGLQSTLRCLYMSQDSYTHVLEKCVSERKWEKIQYGHRQEWKCHHMWNYLHMSIINVKISRDKGYYIFKFLCITGYRDSCPGSWSRWTIRMEQAVYIGTVSSLNKDHQW